MAVKKGYKEVESTFVVLQKFTEAYMKLAAISVDLEDGKVTMVGDGLHWR